MLSARIRYRLTLEDGTLVSRGIAGDDFDFTPGRGEILPVLETLLAGATEGERRRAVLEASTDPELRLGLSRLALLLGHPGKALVFEAEILGSAPPAGAA